ncbi:S-adenosyl-L-methionine-dependent methyltransferase [Auriculariales sp. MPI-PUGE-AT-0066]|nr:S-adenosyl-L-methionine-dependent methyltransferase [Auriculariales sp. MPI-PUGE-AT-0066]
MSRDSMPLPRTSIEPMSALVRRFFTLSLRDNDWPSDGKTLQDVILIDILGSPIYKICPPALDFQKQFWKRVVVRLESYCDIEEVDEQIYKVYLPLISSASSTAASRFEGAPPPSFVTHFWSQPTSSTIVSTTLLEARTTIQDGTTGLRTWGASLMMCQYLQQRPEVVRGKAILELGCGAGLLGLVVSQLGAQSVTLTDCRNDVLQQCRRNADLPPNITSQANIATALLDWSEADDSDDGGPIGEFARSSLVDLIIGTDIVYAVEIIPALVQTLKVFLQHASSLKEIIIALTVRREETFDAFVTKLGAAGICFIVEPVVPELGGDFFLTANDVDASSTFKMIRIPAATRALST